MDTQRINYLYAQYLARQLSSAELNELRGLALMPGFEDQFNSIFDLNWNQLKEDELYSIPQDVAQQMYTHIIAQPKAPAKPISKQLWPRIVAVAAVAVIVSGVYFFSAPRHPNAGQDPATAQYNNIKPGTQGATLTLANGRKIKLSSATNGELAKEAGISITKTADGQVVYNMSSAPDPSLAGDIAKQSYNTLTTAKGETYILVLPDGSKVWMNAASSLTYTSALSNHGQRRVKLSGEAYFEIAKDKTHPFLVESNGQEVEVLGTHFNINAYSNEPVIKTTLLEGSVKVSSLQEGTTKQSAFITLKPGQQSLLTPNNQITVNTVDVETAVAWKNKQFLFESEHIQNIMRMVERWYNVEVIYTGTITKDTFSGGVSRFENISEVLQSLESTGKVHFKIEGRKVYVSP